MLSVKILRVIVRDKFLPGLNCPETISLGRGFFRGDGANYPGVIYKTIEKRKFFQMKVRSNIKTSIEQKLLRI